LNWIEKFILNNFNEQLVYQATKKLINIVSMKTKTPTTNQQINELLCFIKMNSQIPTVIPNNNKITELFQNKKINESHENEQQHQKHHQKNKRKKYNSNQ